MDEHNNYAVDFIEAVREIKATCPPRQNKRRRQQHFFFLSR